METSFQDRSILRTFWNSGLRLQGLRALCSPLVPIRDLITAPLRAAGFHCHWLQTNQQGQTTRDQGELNNGLLNNTRVPVTKPNPSSTQHIAGLRLYRYRKGNALSPCINLPNSCPAKRKTRSGGFPAPLVCALSPSKCPHNGPGVRVPDALYQESEPRNSSNTNPPPASHCQLFTIR